MSYPLNSPPLRRASLLLLVVLSLLSCQEVVSSSSSSSSSSSRGATYDIVATCSASEKVCELNERRVRNALLPFKNQFTLEFVKSTRSMSDLSKKLVFDFTSDRDFSKFNRALEAHLASVEYEKFRLFSFSTISTIKDYVHILLQAGTDRFLLTDANKDSLYSEIKKLKKSKNPKISLFRITIDYANPASEELALFLGLKQGQTQLIRASNSYEKFERVILSKSGHISSAVKPSLVSLIQKSDKSCEGKFSIYHHPQCGHCISAMPEFNKAIKLINAQLPGVVAEKIDCKEQASLCQGQIEGYPTMKFKGEKLLVDRKAEDIVAAVKSKGCFDSDPQIEQIIAPWQLTRHVHKHDQALVLIIKSLSHYPLATHQVIKTFAEVAKFYGHPKVFLAVEDVANRVLTDFLKPKTNAMANVILLRQSSKRVSSFHFDKDVTDASARSNIAKALQKLKSAKLLDRSFIPPFSNQPIYTPYSGNYLHLVKDLDAKLREVDIKDYDLLFSNAERHTAVYLENGVYLQRNYTEFADTHSFANYLSTTKPDESSESDL